MRSYIPTLLLLFAFVAGTTPLASGQSTGQCLPGVAEKDLDVNNVLARVFNTGSLFFGNTTTAGNGYLVPKASEHSPIFASGIWIGGQADGDLRVAGATYSDFEFWPGPLNDDGSLPNPNDCGEFDRIWKVSSLDILNYNATNVATADLATWPAEFGAPVIAGPNNGFDDDGDGLIDEGTDTIDNDGDGFIDERDEKERAVPAVRQAAGLPIYNLNGGDRPEIIGDQALWWVMNDVGNVHANTLSPPIGIEVQVLAFSFARADALNDVTFYRYTVIKKSPGTLEETYLTIFSDPDLGDAADDYVGVDTTLSLGYVYNAGETDATYGIPPATGYDFFQGPIVDADGDGEVDDTLGVTRFSYFENIGQGAPTADPGTGEAIYNYMQGQWADGTPMTEGGNGYQTSGPVTSFAFPGDPVTESFWSEVNVDGSGGDTTPGDRRLLVTTGPFNLSQGDSQTIVFGIVFGQGSSNLNSITVMRTNDALAQAAYDADFELASAPPPPPRCNANSPNPQLRPGSGNCLEAVEINRRAELVWGYPTTNPNYLGSYEVFDQLLAQQDVPDKTYNFEAFKIYRYPNANFEQSERELLATYDVINDVTTVIDTAFSAEIGGLVPFVALTAENTGVQYSFDLTPLGLTNYQDYYFGVTALAYNFWSVPKVIESSATLITVRPSNVIAGNGGSDQQATTGDIALSQNVGIGRGSVFVEVVDPTKVTGATYTVELFTFDAMGDEVLTYRVLRDGTKVFDGQDAYTATDSSVVVEVFLPEDLEDLTDVESARVSQKVVIDGLSFFSFVPPDVPAADLGGAVRFAGEVGTAVRGIIEVQTAGPLAPCEGVSTTAGTAGYDAGCEFYDGNTVYQNPNRTGDYFVQSASTSSALLQADVIGGDDFEMRFTEACATEGACLGAYIRDDGEIVSVPFELWNVRDIRNPDDDVRMIPMIRTTGDDPVPNWADTFTGETITTIGGDERTVGVTDRVYFMMPDRPNGYELFAQDARSIFGGVGGMYDPDADGDTQVDTTASGSDCARQGYYVDFCYRSNPPFRAPIGGAGSAGLQVADLAGDGTTPEAGTTIRFLTAPKPVLSEGDRFVIDTAPLAFETGRGDLAEEALDLIGIVPNPYMGRSAYETTNLDRVVRFINMPDQATIRIYTVSGTLIRTLQKDGPSRSLDWDLNTHNQLPVASGMYLIHVDVPGVGEKVLKFGVVNRRNRITIF